MSEKNDRDALIRFLRGRHAESAKAAANTPDPLTLALAENERLRKALEEIEAMHGKDMCDRSSDRDLGYNDALLFVRDIARAALTPPAKEVPSEQNHH